MGGRGVGASLLQCGESQSRFKVQLHLRLFALMSLKLYPAENLHVMCLFLFCSIFHFIFRTCAFEAKLIRIEKNIQIESTQKAQRQNILQEKVSPGIGSFNLFCRNVCLFIRRLSWCFVIRLLSQLKSKIKKSNKGLAQTSQYILS